MILLLLTAIAAASAYLIGVAHGHSLAAADRSPIRHRRGDH